MRLKGTLILVVCLFCAGPLKSQYKNILLDEQAAAGASVGEPTIAVNPRYPNNIVAGSIPDNVYYTRDAGKTWQKSRLSSPWGVQGDVTLIADPKGNYYYFHLSDQGAGEEGSGKFDRIVLQRSEDGGATWRTGEYIGFDGPKVQRRQRATTDARGNLYVGWTQLDKPGTSECEARVLFSMSKNGKKWSDPFTISQRAGDCRDGDHTPAGAVPAVSYDGKVFVAWAQEEKIYIDRSFNGGELWLSNDILVAEQPGGWDLNVPGHDRCNGLPVLMSDNSKTPYRGSLYLVYADQRNGQDDTDIWFTRSHNFGDNWALPLRVNDDEKGKHQYLPAMAVDQATGYIYIVYYDRRGYDDLQTDVYLAYSTDGGTSFKNVKISENPFTPQEDNSFGDYISISAHEGVVTPIWTRMDDGRTSVWTAVIRHEELSK